MRASRGRIAEPSARRNGAFSPAATPLPTVPAGGPTAVPVCARRCRGAISRRGHLSWPLKFRSSPNASSCRRDREEPDAAADDREKGKGAATFFANS